MIRAKDIVTPITKHVTKFVTKHPRATKEAIQEHLRGVHGDALTKAAKALAKRKANG